MRRKEKIEINKNDDVLINDVPLKDYLKNKTNKRKEIEEVRRESENIPLRKKVYKNLNSEYRNSQITFYSRSQIMDKKLDKIISRCGNTKVFQTVLAHLLKGKNQSCFQITQDILETNNVKFHSKLAVQTVLRKLMKTRFSEYIQLTGSKQNRYFQYKGHNKDFNIAMAIVKGTEEPDIQKDEKNNLSVVKEKAITNDVKSIALPIVKKDNSELTISELINTCISKGLSFEIKIGEPK